LTEEVTWEGGGDGGDGSARSPGASGAERPRTGGAPGRQCSTIAIRAEALEGAGAWEWGT